MELDVMCVLNKEYGAKFMSIADVIFTAILLITIAADSVDCIDYFNKLLFYSLNILSLEIVLKVFVPMKHRNE